MTYIGTPVILGEGEVIKSSSHETACHVIMYFNVELVLALVAIQKCLVLLHDYLGPNTKKLWLHTYTVEETTLLGQHVSVGFLFLNFP